MKIKYFPVLLALIIAVGFTSCKKDEDTIITEIFGSVSAKVDGTDWTSSTGNQIGVKIGDTRMTIVANSMDGGPVIFLYIAGTTVGSYDLTPIQGEISASCYYRESDEGDDTSSNFYSKSGTIEITSITDNRVSGTFSFSASKSLTETKAITEGVFTNVYYTGKSE